MEETLVLSTSHVAFLYISAMSSFLSNSMFVIMKCYCVLMNGLTSEEKWQRKAAAADVNHADGITWRCSACTR